MKMLLILLVTISLFLVSCSSGSYNYSVPITSNSPVTQNNLINTPFAITNNPISTFKYNPIEHTAEVTINFKGNAEKGLFELQLRKQQTPLQSFVYGTPSIPCDNNYPYNIHQTYEGKGDSGVIVLKSSNIPDGTYIPWLVQYSSCCKDDGNCHPISPVGNGYALSDAITFKKNYKADYKDISFIHFYGDVDKEKIMDLIYSINNSYFKGVDDLSVIHTKFSDLQLAGTLNENAEYTPTYQGHGQVKLYFEVEDSGVTKHDLLHELAHHQCWIKGYKWSNNIEAHQGCFPIEFQKLSNN